MEKMEKNYEFGFLIDKFVNSKNTIWIQQALDCLVILDFYVSILKIVYEGKM